MVAINIPIGYEFNTRDNLGFQNPFHQPGVIHSDAYARFELMGAEEFVHMWKSSSSKDESIRAASYILSLPNGARKNVIGYHAEKSGLLDERNFYEG